MFSITGWIMSIAGICLLSIVIDLMISSGKTSSSVKRVVSYAIVLVVLMPLPSLLKSNFTIDDVISKYKLGTQDEYIYSLNQNKLDSMKTDIESTLESKEIYGVVVSISANIFDTNMEINAVYVDLYNMVITNNAENINIKNEVKSVVMAIVKIEEDKIVFNE